MDVGWRVEVGKYEELKGDFQVPELVHWKLSNAIIIFSFYNMGKVMADVQDILLESSEIVEL